MGKSGKERRAIMLDYVKKHDVDSEQSPLNYDLHKYASYVEKHKLDAEKITPDVLEKFRLKNNNLV